MKIQEQKHNGDIGCNTSVFYEDDPCITEDGETFYVNSVVISDKMRHIVLTPKQALSLFGWLRQEEEILKALVKE